jgi:hypothetical protein
MRHLNKNIIDAVANNGDKQSAAINTEQVYAISAIATFTDAASAGTLKFQGSNDVPIDTVAPPSFVPTNWADIPATAGGTVTAGTSIAIEKTSLCYRWVRLTWTRSAGAGTFSVNANTQGF